MAIQEIILTENELPKIYDWVKKTANDAQKFATKSDLKELTIPSEFEDGFLWAKTTYRIVGIEKGLFRDCKKLKTVTIPDTVTDIGESAFENCSALENINIPNTIRNISRATFKGCTSLKGIIIPKGVTKIGQEAFYSCTSLNSLELPDTVVNIGTSAFENCSALKVIDVKDNIESIGTRAFAGCVYLTSKYGVLYIPDGVKIIGDDAFKEVEHVHYDGKATGSPWGAKDFTTTKMLQEAEARKQAEEKKDK